jgi:hypothetical protein
VSTQTVEYWKQRWEASCEREDAAAAYILRLRADLNRALGAIGEVAVLHGRYRGVGDVDSCAECSRIAGHHIPYDGCTTRAALRSKDTASAEESQG